jgi:hypothetical protein
MPKKTKRTCKAKTKTGKPCKAAPLKNRDVCLAHADAETRNKAQFLPGGNGKGGRPKQPRSIDVLRERLEARQDEIIDVYLEAARATTHEIVGHGEDRELLEVPDHAMRLKAVEALHDRAYGKPKQVSEITGPEGGPIAHVGIPDEDDFHKQTAAVLAEAEAIKADA